jgi:hypothetical protein
MRNAFSPDVYTCLVPAVHLVEAESSSVTIDDYATIVRLSQDIAEQMLYRTLNVQ